MFGAFAQTAENDVTDIRQIVEKTEKGLPLKSDEVISLADAMNVKPREIRFVVLDKETKEPIAGALVKGEGIGTSELPVHRDLGGETTMTVPFEMKTGKEGKASFYICGASALDDVTVIAIADGYENASYRLGSFDFGKIYYLTMTKKTK